MNKGFLIRGNWVTKELSSFAKERSARNNLSRTIEDILENYGGFDGHPWPLYDDEIETRLENYLISADSFDYAKSYFLKQKAPGKLLFVKQGLDPYSQDLDLSKNKFRWMGFEYGYCDEMQGLYSCVLNEIVCGQYSELARYTQQLNEHLLFEKISDIENLIKNRCNIFAKKVDLEKGNMSPWSVWSYKNS